MALTEKLEMVLTLDAKGARKGFEKVGRTADRELKRASSRIDQVSAGMRKAGAAMLTMGGVVAVGLWKAGEAASDLAEAANVTGLVFGEAAEDVGRFAEEAAEGLGMSERAARDATTQFGGLLKNFGFAQTETVQWSKDLTALAADMASAFNTNPEDAVVALGAAIRGEQKPIRRFNVFLDDQSVKLRAVEMGLAATTAEVDLNDKAQARLAMIMEQTSDIHGDFANTSDLLANKQRILSAEWENAQASLGEAVLPLMTELVGTAGDAVSKFAALNQESGGLVGQLAVMGTGFLIVGGGIASVVGQMIKMRDTLGGIGRNADGALTTFGRMSRVLGGVTAAAAAGAAVFFSWQQMVDNARRSGEEFADGVRTDVLDELSSGDRGLEGIRAKMQGIADQTAELDSAIKGSSAPWDRDKREEMHAAQMELGALAVELGNIENMAIAMGAATGESADDFAAWLESAAMAGETFTDTDAALEAFNTELLEGLGLSSDHAAAVAEQGQSFVDVERDISEAEDALKSWEAAVAGAFDPLFAMADAEQSVKDANRDLADAQADVNAAIAEGDWEAHKEAQEGVYEAERDLLQANLDLDVSARKLQQSIESGDTSMGMATNTLAEWAEQGRVSFEAAESLTAQLGLLAAKADELDGKSVLLNIDLDPASMQRFDDTLTRRFGDSGTTFTAPALPGGTGLHSGGRVPGTSGQQVAINAHAGEYVLSEDVVNAIKRGGRSRGLTGTSGGGVAMNFYGYTDDALVRNVEDATAQLAWSSVSGRADG